MTRKRDHIPGESNCRRKTWVVSPARAVYRMLFPSGENTGAAGPGSSMGMGVRGRSEMERRRPGLAWA
jgi:hypothetical protein